MKINWKYIEHGDIVLEINDQIWAHLTQLDSGKYRWGIDVPNLFKNKHPHYFGESSSLIAAKDDVLRIISGKIL